MSGPIAQYWTSLGFRIDRKELRKVDTTLKQTEDKLRRFGKKIDRHLRINLDVNKFTVDQKKLNLALGNALDLASARLVFQVNNFDINQARLNQQMATAVGRASRLASARVNPDVNVRERLPRETLRRGDAVAVGGIGGIAARMYAPAVGLALGGYGLGQVNRRNQEVISSQLTTQAVLEAAGLQGQGPQAFEWLRSQGNRVGFNYLDASQDYNNFLSNALGSGLGLEQSQETFLGFAEYARAMGITPARQKLVLNAAAQMFGKGSVQSEELRRQMAESMPGTMSAFAEALQRMRGTNLTGEEAMQALYDTLKPGKNINTKQLAPFLAQVLREKAAPKLDIAMKTSQAEQARFQNMMSDQAIRASGAGVESGFARLFRSMTIALKEASPLVESMARGFDSVSLSVSKALLSIQSIQRFFQGRDSFLGDKFFPTEESKAKAFEFLERVKIMMQEMDKLVTNISNGWSMLIEQMGSSTILDKINNTIMTITNAMNALNKLADGDFSGAVEAAKSFAKQTINTITTPGRTGANALLSTFTEARIPTPFANVADPLGDKARKAATMDSNSIYYNDPAGFDQMLKDRQMAAMDQYYPHGSSVGSTSVDIKMDVSIQAANPEDFNQQFQEKFKSVIQDTLIQYSQKE